MHQSTRRKNKLSLYHYQVRGKKPRGLNADDSNISSRIQNLVICKYAPSIICILTSQVSCMPWVSQSDIGASITEQSLQLDADPKIIIGTGLPIFYENSCFISICLELSRVILPELRVEALKTCQVVGAFVSEALVAH